MLRNKLIKQEQKVTQHSKSPTQTEVSIPMDEHRISGLFAKPFWARFYDLECELNKELNKVRSELPITHIYNPVEYAAELHCDYLRRYLDGPKGLVFVGMNPGPNGMGQTGVPFGNITTVRDVMGLSGDCRQPPNVHYKRPITGLCCTKEEPSGARMWNLMQHLAGGSLEMFARRSFIHNFCPLAFFDKNGRNLTPSELKSPYKTKIRDLCLQALDKQITLLEPEVIVAVGEYVHDALKKSAHKDAIRMLKMPHPSPRSLNNQDWPAKAEQFLRDNDLIKYICASV